MTDRLPGLAPGDFAWITANSGLNQSEPPLVAPPWSVAKNKTELDAIYFAPRRFSWRNRPSLAPVSYQGANATCVAHAACRMIETHYRQQGQTISLNAECAHQCIYGYACSMPAGLVSGVTDKLQIKGAPQAPGFVAGNACPVNAALGLVAVPRLARNTSAAQTKSRIASSGPALAVLTLGSDFEHLAAPFVYRGLPAGSKTFNHAVLLIGYDDDDQGGMWECQNSFGPGWGDHGYFHIPYAVAAVVSDDLHPTFSVA